MNQSDAPESLGGDSSTASSPEILSATPGPVPAVPKWFRAFPYFLSAFLFLSSLFALFAPLPLLLLSFRPQGRRWAWLAALTNTLLVTWVAQSLGTAVYAIVVVVPALLLPELMKRKRSLELSTGLTLVAVFVTAFLAFAAYAHGQHAAPFVQLKLEISNFFDLLFKSLTEDAKSSLLENITQEEFKESLLSLFPARAVIFVLAMIWLNIILVLRLNPERIREQMGLQPSYFSRWKVPEWFIWPTIIAGFSMLREWGWPSDLGKNFFEVSKAVYAIQGLSILTFFLDAWTVRGIFRMFAYLLGIVLMLPIVQALGFFDLWFDFRAKLRQS